MNKSFEANIYTPDWSFISVLKDYISIVWTDRYNDLGDFELVLPLNKENLQIYSPDNYIVCNQSDKVMIIEEIVTSASSEGYKMKVTGHSAEALLRRRVMANELIINAQSKNTVYIPGKNKPSHFAGALAKAFEICFNQNSVNMMSESNSQNAIQSSSVNRSMPIIRFAGIVSDPFNHITDAIGNIDSYGDEYYEIIKDLCEAKDIGFALYRNYDKEIDRSKEVSEDIEATRKAKYLEANTEGLFDLVLYDGWNRTGNYLLKEGLDTEIIMQDDTFDTISGVVFSVEYLNLQSSDSSYSKENYKNYIFVKGDEVNSGSSASVDVAEATANFTEAFTDEDAKYYVAGAYSDDEYGIFKRETFGEAGFSRGLNTRYKYASRLRAKGAKLLKDQKAKWILSCEIGNLSKFEYRKDYYLGDLITVKDSMDNANVFRVTEEIISSDASGLKVYPTLVLFDPFKYVEDDSIEDVDPSARCKIEWRFDGGLLSLESIQKLYNRFINTSGTPSPDPNDWPANTADGEIIELITSVTPWNAGLSQTPGSTINYQELQKRLIGVNTYQIVGDYIGFPVLNGDNSGGGDYVLGDFSNDPNNPAESELSKEHYYLKYWDGSGGRFIKYEPSLETDVGIECTGWALYTAHWTPEYYRITFKHGDGGRFGSGAFSNSYCKINEIPEWQSSPPTYRPNKFYEKVVDWYRDAPYYKILSSSTPPYGWDNPTSETYYTHYYATSKELDTVFKDVAYNSMPSAPYCSPEADYSRDNPAWDPIIVRATEDATYTARWIRKDVPEDEDEGDDNDDSEEDWDDRDDDESQEQGGGGSDKQSDSEKVNAPIKNRQGGTLQDGVYYGEEETNNIVASGVSMVTFREINSRVADNWKEEKDDEGDTFWRRTKDAENQHSAFYYNRPIGRTKQDGSSTAYFHAFWAGANHLTKADPWPYGSVVQSPALGVCITREDGGVIWSNIWGFSAYGYYPGRYFPGLYPPVYKCPEVSFTNSPSLKKIIGYKALTSKVYTGDGTNWPKNKIYKYNGSTFTVINEKPDDWDENDGWKKYCRKQQVGAKYGVLAQGYDDLGIIFYPGWKRSYAEDYPDIQSQVTGYDDYQITYAFKNAPEGKSKDADYSSCCVWFNATTQDGPNYPRENYITSGWKWLDVPDGKWYGPKRGTNLSVPEGAKFFCTWTLDGAWGAMYQHNGQDLTYMPEQWGDPDYMANVRFKADTVYLTDSFRSASSSDYSIASAFLYGPPAGTPVGPGASRNPLPYYTGFSTAGDRLMLPKLSGDTKSCLIQLDGYSQSVTVKPGSKARFWVNVSSLIKSVSFKYEWYVLTNVGLKKYMVSSEGTLSVYDSQDGNCYIYKWIGDRFGDSVQPGWVYANTSSELKYILDNDPYWLWTGMTYPIESPAEADPIENWEKVGEGKNYVMSNVGLSLNNTKLKCKVTATYSIYNETISESIEVPSTGTMVLYVTEDAPDDPEADPSDYDKENEEMKENSEKATPEEWPVDGGNVIIDITEGNITYRYQYKYVGASPIPPKHLDAKDAAAALAEVRGNSGKWQIVSVTPVGTSQAPGGSSQMGTSTSDITTPSGNVNISGTSYFGGASSIPAYDPYQKLEDNALAGNLSPGSKAFDEYVGLGFGKIVQGQNKENENLIVADEAYQAGAPIRKRQ